MVYHLALSQTPRLVRKADALDNRYQDQQSQSDDEPSTGRFLNLIQI